MIVDLKPRGLVNTYLRSMQHPGIPFLDVSCAFCLEPPSAIAAATVHAASANVKASKLFKAHGS